MPCLLKIFIENFIKNSKFENILFSDEGLDYIRYHHELKKLIELFPKESNIIPILCIREIHDWKNSWIEYLKKTQKNTSDKNSPYYPTEKSWIFEIDKLLNLLNENFKHVIKIDYNNNIVSEFFESLGISISTKEYRLNITRKNEEAK